MTHFRRFVQSYLRRWWFTRVNFNIYKLWKARKIIKKNSHSHPICSHFAFRNTKFHHVLRAIISWRNTNNRTGRVGCQDNDRFFNFFGLTSKIGELNSEFSNFCAHEQTALRADAYSLSLLIRSVKQRRMFSSRRISASCRRNNASCESFCCRSVPNPIIPVI